MELFHDPDVPSLSTLWDFLDYGPPEVASEDVARHSTNTSSPDDSHPSVLLSNRHEPDLGLSLSNNYTPDTDDDGSGSCVVEKIPSKKHLWSEDSEPESLLEDEFEAEDISLRYLLRLRASARDHKSEGGSSWSSEDMPPVEERPNLLSILAALAFPELSKKSGKKSSKKSGKKSGEKSGKKSDKQSDKKKKRRKNSTEVKDSNDISDQLEKTPCYDIVLKPETRPMSQEQLVAEVKGIYAGLVMVEAKCKKADNKEATLAQGDSPEQLRLNNEQWQALVTLHRTLLHEHHDFFLPSQHPSASPALRQLASKNAMPARIWRHGIHSLDALEDISPPTSDYVLAFTNLARSMEVLSNETVPAFDTTWDECFNDPSQASPAKDNDIKAREALTEIFTKEKPPLFESVQDPQSSCTANEANSSKTAQESSSRSSQTGETSSSSSGKPSIPNHICTKCNASFKRPYELRKHEKYHTKPIACPDCTCRFGRQRDLTRHQKSMHKDVYEPEQWFCSFETC